MSYSDLLQKHRRLAILRYLEESPEYTSNASILTDVCNSVGVSSTRDQIKSDLAWLREAGLVEYDAKADFVVVTATERGADIATGRATDPGVQRPRRRS